MKSLNNINCIHDNKVKYTAEFNLLHEMINPSICPKNINIHYSPILYGCMDTRKVEAKSKNFRILLDIGCIYTIVMRSLILELDPKEGNVMQWHMQAGNITTNLKFKIDSSLPIYSAKHHGV